MSLKVLDHSTALRDPVGFAKAARAMGFAAVMRYLPLPPGTLQRDAVGRLNRAEIAALHAEGLGVGLVWETTQYRPVMGAAGGLADGLPARNAANALGFPPDQVIYGAVDFDPNPGQLPAIIAYLGAAGFEPYANGPTCKALSSIGFTHFWMHNWGGAGFSDPHIHQQGGQVTVAGISCDLNDAYHIDCIWWPPVPVVPVGGGQTLYKGANVRVDVNIPAGAVVNGRGWVDIPVPPGLGVSGQPVMNGSEALLGQSLPRPGFAPYDIGGGKWRVEFDGLPAGGCDLHIPLG